MISAVISTLNSARDLHGLLSALVPAAADGLVRQVLVVDGGSTDGTLDICEDAGADCTA
jgi:glycosyltransferase involved in cell wall biosynthesis